MFMGLVSLGTNQFWGRLLLTFMQPSRYPREPYVEHISHKSLHRFTMIQLALFVLLYVVKSIKTIAIAFPVIIAFCIPFRVFVLPKLFTEEELIMLDSDETAIQNWLASKAKLEEREDYHIDSTDKMKLGEEPMEVADLIVLEEEEEDRDQITPLPAIGEGTSGEMIGGSSQPPRRRRRVKAVSCPTGGSLFGEEPFPMEEIRIKAHPQDYVEASEPVPAETETIVDVVEAGAATLRRRRRQRTVSCPPHMLFTEAERHVNQNYFFG